MPEPCEQAGEIRRINERLHLGDLTLQDINTTLKSIEASQAPVVSKLEEMHKRMFIDNGKKSIQSNISNMGVHIRLQWFFIGGIALAIVVGAIKIVWF